MPNRIIKETICTSDNLNELSPEAEVFFYRLMVNCDDFGRLDARPQILRAKCFPLKIDTIKTDFIEKWLADLLKAELIILYQVDGRPYLQLTTWSEHQQIRAKKSKYPGPEDGEIISTDSNEQQNNEHDISCNHLISDDINCNHVQSNVTVIENRNRNRESEAESYSESSPNQNSAAETIAHVFEKEFGRPLSPMEYQQILAWAERHDQEIIKEALRRAVLNGKYNLRYIDKILLTWEKANRRTLRDVLEYERAFEQSKYGRQPSQDDAKKVVEIQAKRKDEKIKAACEYIKLQLGNSPPKNKAVEIAKTYGEELVPVIIDRLYGGGEP